MNQQFAKHCTSTAFQLSLSRTAIDALFELQAFAKRYGLPLYQRSTESYLMRRGLIERPQDAACQMNWLLSDAGRLVCELLQEAGFENEYLKIAQQRRIENRKAVC